jgi:predicted nucleotidyltransferase
MKKYVNKISKLINYYHPDAECECYDEYVLDEEFMCDLCLARLKKHRGKIKREFRRESKIKYKQKYNQE